MTGHLVSMISSYAYSRYDESGAAGKAVLMTSKGIERSTWVWTVPLRDGEIKTGSAQQARCSGRRRTND
jgi:hypothetical protein